MTIFKIFKNHNHLNGPISYKSNSSEGPKISTFLHPLKIERVSLSYYNDHIFKCWKYKLPIWALNPHYRFYSSHFGLNLLIIWPYIELSKMISSHIYSRSTNLILVRSLSNPYLKFKLHILDQYSHIRISSWEPDTNIAILIYSNMSIFWTFEHDISHIYSINTNLILVRSLKYSHFSTLSEPKGSPCPTLVTIF